ncbi:flagellar biosynthesis protein FlgH [Candidatus Aerophobetes bacterium]|uniref:Flagellar L-ring protein n=1 Tax=Aerophobetes bacterium TaxID=2030807 RepID=A0A662DHI2_UNCAE|nr:MAG: flagellar biosynthesis protein FlgH [Candidatus Aerophobetes bacterium]
MKARLTIALWMRILFIFILSLFICQPLQAEKIVSLFTTPRASKVGDTLTVIISEFSTASQTAKTDFGKSTETKGKVSLPSSDLSGGWNYSTDYEGSGSTQRKGTLVAKVTVEVVEVLSNGNLRVKGGKRVRINQEEQVIYLEGIVRPQDIGENNTISSVKIAQATIRYEGKGPVNEGRRPGLISRLFNWLGIF